MPVQYTNRKGQTYYLHQTVTRAGKTTYFFSRSDDGNLVDTMPPGYELYESPNGLVFLRKIRAKLITDDEVALVEKELKRNRHLKSYRVDVKHEMIRVYTPTQELDGYSKLLSRIVGGEVDVEAILARHATYTEEMRFILVDKEKRLFDLQRRTYVSSLPEWFDVRWSELLPNLAPYVKHLDQESFFTLGPGAKP